MKKRIKNSLLGGGGVSEISDRLQYMYLPAPSPNMW